MDSTQNVFVYDQLAISLRFVLNGVVKTRFLKNVNTIKTYEKLKKDHSQRNIELGYCKVLT